MKHQKMSASPIVKPLFFASCLALILGAGTFRPGLTRSQEERKVNVHTYSRMPLAVREIRNLQKKEDWFRDLEIEVKNISGQPIYFISLSLEFPDIPAPTPTPRPDNGFIPRSTTGFSVTYGADRLMDVRQLAGPEDIPLAPGETYVFKIPESRALGFESMNRQMSLPPQTWNRIELEIDTVSFGDGTGYVGSRKIGVSKKKG